MKAGWVLLFVTLCSVMQQAGYYCYLMFCHATGWVLLFVTLCSVMQQAGYYCYFMFCHERRLGITVFVTLCLVMKAGWVLLCLLLYVLS